MDLVEARALGFEAGGRHPWERARLALVARLIARHTILRPGDVVLDVGCGDTFVVERLARAHPGVSFHAVDSAFTADVMAIYRSRLTVSNVSLFASLDDVPRDRPASLVLLMDVIEHVADDVGLLRDLMARPYVDKKTRVLITVPSYSSLFCSHDRFLGHYRRYSARTLSSAIVASGLAAIEAGHLFASLLPVRVLQVLRERVSQRIVEPATGLATWRGSESVARALAALLELDGRLALMMLGFGIRVPGLSKFAVCRKSA